MVVLFPKRAVIAGTLALLVPLVSLWDQQARALETVKIRLPLLETSFIIRLGELGDASSLWRGNSDMAELDRATRGAIGRKLLGVLNSPLPLGSTARASFEMAVGTPLLRQALLTASALVRVEGLSPVMDGRKLAAALQQAEAQGPITVLSLLRELPGETAELDLDRTLLNLRRLKQQHQQADRLLASRTAASIDPALSNPGTSPVLRRSLALAVDYRPEPLAMVLLSPTAGSNGHLVVISHGLWDSPASFEGWGRHLASHGFTVVLPVHPGSDLSQQERMLSGEAPPPGPEELRLRPLDITSLLNGIEAGKLPELKGRNTDSTVVIGHSWGGTTALQLAGMTPSSDQLKSRCDNLDDPERNLSWVLQCSFLSSADRASLADRRVTAVVAVSPPMGLIFGEGSTRAMSGRALVVSGSRDWLVPPDPEAVLPFLSQKVDMGHRLVLAQGGTHFNLPSGASPTDGDQASTSVTTDNVAGGVLRGLLLAWVRAAFAAGGAARPGPGAPSLLPISGWGHATVPLVDVSPSLAGGGIGSN